MLLAVLGAMAVAGDTLTGGERAPIGPQTINELIFPAFCPPRVHLVKLARDHNAPGLEGSFIDGALDFFSPGWSFSAHAPHLGVQNSNDIVSIWNSDPSDFRMVKCGRGHDPGVNDSIRATGGQLLQFCDSTFEYNYGIPELSPCSNFTTRFKRAEPVRCVRALDGHQEQPTECLPPVPTVSSYHAADFRPNSTSELHQFPNPEFSQIPITDLERSTRAGLNTPPEPCRMGGHSKLPMPSCGSLKREAYVASEG